MVPHLVKAGIKYLHIGINGSSKMVKLPPLCRLRYGEDEVVLDYAALYGASSSFGEYAMEFAHTPDNSGPPSPESVAAEMERLHKKYPARTTSYAILAGYCLYPGYINFQSNSNYPPSSRSLLLASCTLAEAG